ncbi:MAG: hemin uptake protein HemP [Pseudomonadota bacterium]
MGLQKIAPTTDQPTQRLPCFDARSLVGDTGQANIILDDQVYVLRITRAGKLILTK